jgi:prepilin-type N-terminal cleavage/methylation domain-containing protein
MGEWIFGMPRRLPAGRVRDCRGFTLVEVLLSILILGFSAVAISDVYTTGLNSLETRVHEGQLDTALRSQMERLLAQKFDQLANGSRAITVEGDSFILNWTVANVDLDGDATPEPGAKQITLTLGDKTLVTVVADHGGLLGKL